MIKKKDKICQNWTYKVENWSRIIEKLTIFVEK